MENKDSIKYQSRKFKLSLCGHSDGNGTFDFDIPPPSDIAFSDKYRSCLILLRSISITANAGPVTTLALAPNGQPFGRGLNATWVAEAPGAPQVAASFRQPDSGILVLTDLPCKQHASAQVNDAIAAPVIAAASKNIGNGRYFKVIPNAVERYTGVIGRLDGAGFAAGPGYQAMNCDGTQEIRFGGAIAGAGGAVLEQRKPVWSYETDADILDEGLLGATPFGRKLQIRLIDPLTNDEIWLFTPKDNGVAAAAGDEQTCLTAEFEFLMMN